MAKNLPSSRPATTLLYRQQYPVDDHDDVDNIITPTVMVGAQQHISYPASMLCCPLLLARSL
jgi:hypothetical protein